MPSQPPPSSPPTRRSHATAAVTAAAYPRTRTPIWARKRDLFYLIFFLVHIPVILFVDLYAIYPPHLQRPFMTHLRTYYISTYNDQFSIAPPAWFDMYMWMEALYHLPMSMWAVGALWRDDPVVPLHLLVFAVQTGVTTLTCVADMMSWTAVTRGEKWALGALYGPYLALAVFMGVDCFARVRGRLVRV